MAQALFEKVSVEEVNASLGGDEEYLDRLRDLECEEQVRDVVRAYYDAVTDEADLDGLWNGIEAEIGSQ
jgi:hypothetical protein